MITTRSAFGAWAATAFTLALSLPANAQSGGDDADDADQTEASAASSSGGGEPIQVVITGTRLGTESIDVPADVKVIRRDRLQRPGVKSAPGALSDVSGVKLNSRQENAIFNDLEVRGLTGNATSGGNVLVLLDGIPQRRLSFGGPYMGALPYETIMRAELVKGPSSSLYGRNALAGALQLFSDPGGEQTRMDVSGWYEYPTQDMRLGLRASGPMMRQLDGGTQLSTWSLAGSANYVEGWQPRTQAEKTDLYAHVNWYLTERDNLTLLGGFFSGTEGYVAPVPVDATGQRMFGVERDANLGVPGQNQLDLHELRMAARHTREWSEELNSKLTVSWWRGDSRWAVGRPDDRPAEGTVMARPTSDRHYLENVLFTEVELQARWSASRWVSGRLSAGASYEYLQYIMTGADITTQDALQQSGGKYTAGIPLDLGTLQETGQSAWVYGQPSRRDTFEHDAGVFLRKQIALVERVFVSAGARYDWFERTQENPDTSESAEHSDSAWSPSAGVSVAVLREERHKLNLFGTWGRGFSPVFRAVNNTQFADVKPETSQSAEAGVKTLLYKQALEATATVYQLDRRDIVAMNPQTRLQENVGDWRIRGVETDLRWRPLRPVALFGAYTWRSPTIQRWEADSQLRGHAIPSISRHVLTGGVEAHAPFGLGGGTSVRYASAFYGNEQNSFELPAYALWDAWLSYDLAATARVSVFARNLLDTEYYTAVFSSVKNGSAFAGTPRTVGGSFHARF